MFCNSSEERGISFDDSWGTLKAVVCKCKSWTRREPRIRMVPVDRILARRERVERRKQRGITQAGEDAGQSIQVDGWEPVVPGHPELLHDSPGSQTDPEMRSR